MRWLENTLMGRIVKQNRFDEKGRAPVLPIGVSVSIGTFIVLTLVAGSVYAYDTMYNYPKDEGAIESASIVINLAQKGREIQCESWITGPDMMSAKMVLYFAFLRNAPSENAATAIDQVKNAPRKYQWIKEYTIDAPSQTPMVESFDYGEAIGEYAPELYAISVIELSYKHHSWFHTAGPKYEMKSITISVIAH